MVARWIGTRSADVIHREVTAGEVRTGPCHMGGGESQPSVTGGEVITSRVSQAEK